MHSSSGRRRSGKSFGRRKEKKRRGCLHSFWLLQPFVLFRNWGQIGFGGFFSPSLELGVFTPHHTGRMAAAEKRVQATQALAIESSVCLSSLNCSSRKMRAVTPLLFFSREKDQGSFRSFPQEMKFLITGRHDNNTTRGTYRTRGEDRSIFGIDTRSPFFYRCLIASRNFALFFVEW